METINHLPFILGSYAAAFIVIAALVAWVALDFRAQHRALADLERRGLTRRSAAQRPERMNPAADAAITETTIADTEMTEAKEKA